MLELEHLQRILWAVEQRRECRPDGSGDRDVELEELWARLEKACVDLRCGGPPSLVLPALIDAMKIIDDIETVGRGETVNHGAPDTPSR